MVDNKQVVLRALVIAFLGVNSLSISAPGDGERRMNIMVSANWTCRYTHKVNTAHFADESGNADDIYTLARVRCEETSPRRTGASETFVMTCKAAGREKAPNFADCVKTTTARGTSYENVLLSQQSNNDGSDKYGRSCKYEFGKAAAFWRKMEDNQWDAICASPLSCTEFRKGPSYFLAACLPERWTKVNRRNVPVCPRANDCVDNALPLTHAYTEAELAAARKRTVTTRSTAIGNSSTARRDH